MKKKQICLKKKKKNYKIQLKKNKKKSKNKKMKILKKQEKFPNQKFKKMSFLEILLLKFKI